MKSRFTVIIYRSELVYYIFENIASHRFYVVLDYYFIVAGKCKMNNSNKYDISTLVHT